MESNNAENIAINPNVRKIEVLRSEASGIVWRSCILLDVKKGDRFRMFEPDGVAVPSPG
jgi:hypothetical protein